MFNVSASCLVKLATLTFEDLAKILRSSHTVASKTDFFSLQVLYDKFDPEEVATLHVTRPLVRAVPELDCITRLDNDALAFAELVASYRDVW